MKSEGMSRRQFMATTAIGVGSVASMAAANTKSGQVGGAVKTRRDKTIIKTVFMAKPVPTWPCPDLDVPAEVQKINAILEDLRKVSDRKIEFVGGELVRTADDIPRFRQTLGDVDGILAFNLTSTCGPMFNPIVEMGYPTVLFSQPYSGHDWSRVGGMIRQGKKVDVVASSDFYELEPFLRIFDTIRKAKQTKILCLRSNLQKGEGLLAMEKQYGVTVELMDYAELNGLYEKSDAKLAAKLADEFIAGATKMIEPKRDDVIKSMRLYLAIQELLAKYGSDVITIDCLGGFKRGDLPAYPCVAWSKLNDAGRIGVCEADLDATVTQVLLQYLANKPGFVSDPVIDTKTNTVIHAHCVSATKMDGPQGSSAPYAIRTHMEDNKGVAVQVKMRVGQEITLAKIANSHMLISTGEIVDNPESNRGCRTKVTTKVADADKMLHAYTGGLHRVLVYGNHVRDVQRMGRLLGFSVVEEI